MIKNLTSKIKNLRQHSGFMKYFKNTSWLFTAIATLGLEGIVVRELVKDEGRLIKQVALRDGIEL